MVMLNYFRSPMCSKVGCIMGQFELDTWRCRRACDVTASNDEMRWWLKWCGW